MSQQDERTHILNMVAEGQITAMEGAQLLEALGEDDQGAAPGSDPAPQPEPSPANDRVAAPRADVQPKTNGSATRLRIKVIERNGARVNVNLPLSLMEVGLKFGGRFVDELQDMDDEMQMLMEAIRNDVTGKIVEVDDDDSHVEIFIE